MCIKPICSLNSIVVAITLFFWTSTACPQQITIRNENKIIWEGELGAHVIVEYKETGEEKHVEGELVKKTSVYIQVDRTFIFIKTIQSITSESEPQSDDEPIIVWILDGKLTDKDGKEIHAEELLQGNDSVLIELHRLERLGTEDQSKLLINEPEHLIEDITEKTIVIPLIGQVGITHDDGVGDAGWFNAWLLEELFIKAKRDKDNVTKIILEITSPGGYVIELHEICELIEKYRNEFHFIAYPHDAFSAASIIVMTCDELIASTDSKVGAAVVIDGNGDAVGEKYESANASKIRTYFINGGQPVEIASAFCLIVEELWFNETSGTFASEIAEGAEGWELLDDSESILTLDSQQLLKYGLAERQLNSLSHLYQKDEFEDWTSEVTVLMRKNRKSAEAFSKELHDVWEHIKEIENYEDILRSAVSLDDSKKYNSVYKKFRKAVAKAVIKSKDVLKNVDKGKYHFYIRHDVLRRLATIRDLGQHILDDKQNDHKKIFRHLDEMRDAYNSLVP